MSPKNNTDKLFELLKTNGIDKNTLLNAFESVVSSKLEKEFDFENIWFDEVDTPAFSYWLYIGNNRNSKKEQFILSKLLLWHELESKNGIKLKIIFPNERYYHSILKYLDIKRSPGLLIADSPTFENKYLIASNSLVTSLKKANWESKLNNFVNYFVTSTTPDVISDEIERFFEQQFGSEIKPRIFIGSSTEGLTIARKVQNELSNDFETEIWNQGTFENLGQSYLESLEQTLERFDFGIFIFSTDDKIESRGNSHFIVRDNVIFELGMFLGKLSRFNSFILYPKEDNIKILSDFHGIIKASYVSKSQNLSSAVAPACDIIRDNINRKFNDV